MKTKRISKKWSPKSAPRAHAVKAKLVRIGNSRGVRLPKAVLEQSGLPEEFEIHVRNGQIILQRPENPRAGWDEAFRKAGPVPPLTAEEKAWLAFPNEFDKEEWTW